MSGPPGPASRCVTSATGAQLDANFLAAAKIGGIPCGVSGTNAITLTPTAGITPTLAAYANYLQFSGIVATTNTSAVTIQVNGVLPTNQGNAIIRATDGTKRKVTFWRSGQISVTNYP